jgi:hypothetical protein
MIGLKPGLQKVKMLYPHLQPYDKNLLALD